MVAVKGSKFAASNGDEAGVAGGVTSGTFIKESTWDLVFLRRQDGGPPTPAGSRTRNSRTTEYRRYGRPDAGALSRHGPSLIAICALVCACDKTPLPSASGESDLKQECVEKALIAADDAAQGQSPIKAEIPVQQ